MMLEIKMFLFRIFAGYDYYSVENLKNITNDINVFKNNKDLDKGFLGEIEFKSKYVNELENRRTKIINELARRA